MTPKKPTKKEIERARVDCTPGARGINPRVADLSRLSKEWLIALVVELEASAGRALDSGRLLERQEIRAWIERRRREARNECVEREDTAIIELLGNGEWREDCK